MENKTEILKEMGYDITPIITALENPEAIKRLSTGRSKSDVIIEPFTEEDIVLFSNTIYTIVKKLEG